MPIHLRVDVLVDGFVGDSPTNRIRGDGGDLFLRPAEFHPRDDIVAEYHVFIQRSPAAMFPVAECPLVGNPWCIPVPLGRPVPFDFP